MESMVDVSNSNYKKSLEYLFYGIDPNAPSVKFKKKFKNKSIRKYTTL